MYACLNGAAVSYPKRDTYSMIKLQRDTLHNGVGACAQWFDNDLCHNGAPRWADVLLSLGVPWWWRMWRGTEAARAAPIDAAGASCTSRAARSVHIEARMPEVEWGGPHRARHWQRLCVAYRTGAPVVRRRRVGSRVDASLEGVTVLVMCIVSTPLRWRVPA